MMQKQNSWSGNELMKCRFHSGDGRDLYHSERKSHQKCVQECKSVWGVWCVCVRLGEAKVLKVTDRVCRGVAYASADN